MEQNHIEPRRILVVDDDSAIRELLRRILESGGYDVLTASNGRSAIDLLKEHGCDLVITDLVMPEQEGIETIKIVRKSFPAVKVIAMSGAFGGEYLRIAQFLGAHGTLPKPLRIDAVLAAVKQALD